LHGCNVTVGQRSILGTNYPQSWRQHGSVTASARDVWQKHCFLMTSSCIDSKQ
jgi:hypothetical protein